MCDWKKIGIATIAGTILLGIVFALCDFILGSIFPFDPVSFPGSRALTDPTLMWFLLYPVLVAFAGAYVYDNVHKAIRATGIKKGLYFGKFMFLIETAPTMLLVFTTMTYPDAFYYSNIIRSIIAYGLLGILFTKIWKEK